MSAASHGAAAGGVLGLVFVLLAQQLGYLNLSDLVPAVEYLFVGILVGGLLFGAIGMALGRLYRRSHPGVSREGVEKN